MSSQPSPYLVVAALLGLAACGGGGADPGGPTGNGNDFHPTSNTSLSGNVTYQSVTIPSGVTVTVSSDLVLTVRGDVTIAGTLRGSCVAITIKAEGVFSNTGGTIDNSCATEPDAGGPGLLVIGKGGINVDGGQTITSGDSRFTNDASQTLATPAGVVGYEALRAHDG